LTLTLLTASDASAQSYAVVDVDASRLEDVTYYDARTRSTQVLIAGRDFDGDHCLFCAGKDAVITVLPKGESRENARALKGPFAESLDNLVKGKTGKKYNQTLIAVEKGEVKVSTDVMGRPFTVSVKGGQTLQEQGGAEATKPFNLLSVNTCGYMKPLYVPHLSLSRSSAAELEARARKEAEENEGGDEQLEPEPESSAIV